MGYVRTLSKESDFDSTKPRIAICSNLMMTMGIALELVRSRFSVFPCTTEIEAAAVLEDEPVDVLLIDGRDWIDPEHSKGIIAPEWFGRVALSRYGVPNLWIPSTRTAEEKDRMRIAHSLGAITEPVTSPDLGARIMASLSDSSEPRFSIDAESEAEARFDSVLAAVDSATLQVVRQRAAGLTDGLRNAAASWEQGYWASIRTSMVESTQAYLASPPNRLEALSHATKKSIVQFAMKKLSTLSNHPDIEKRLWWLNQLFEELTADEVDELMIYLDGWESKLASPQTDSLSVTIDSIREKAHG